MSSRRAFVRALAGAAALPGFRPDALRRVLDLPAPRPGTGPASAGGPDDEDYWAEIQRAFDCDRTMVNLNNGGVCPTPTHVLEQMIRDLRFTNELPVIHMWQTLEPRIESVRRDLATAFGCDPEEMAITRNASEANEIMIQGLDLKPGDEVVVTNQNYPRMITTWQQRVRREGIVLKQVSFKVPPPSPEYLVQQFTDAVTPRTRAIEVTHITNLTGQIMPVRELVRFARPRGIEVFVDGAHAFAHFPFTRDDLECDFYGTSLHKWLLAPIGTGFLYVRKARQKRLWPLMAAPESMDDNVRKYEEIGTHPAANHNAISVAMAFHNAIGSERKIARLRYLRDRWAKRVQQNDRIRILTPLDSPWGAGIGLVHVDGMDPGALVTWLFTQHRIVTTPINHPEFNGVRVTPNVYTTVAEVDLFADRLLQGVQRGIG
ncbi:MAG TPA: aminotransferase class V-fold PLP-dependent enzyme [Gemmatimonadales bacterium]|nr:aminotransferase class V-fold PLP-dependent enzyme [Gemmatimonadales bacterium]